MRIPKLISNVVSTFMIAGGVVLVGFFALNVFGATSQTTATNATEPGGFNVPELGAREEYGTGGPEDKTLRLTIPGMSRIEGASVPDASGEDTETLDSNAAIHLRGTGFPWREGANTYIAGHRLGYPGSPSFLAFYDLPNLENGDEIFVTDADGTRYSYRVFEEFVVGPGDLSVTEPVPGKSVLTLQTCTLPDYSKRLIVRAELVEKS